MSSGGSSTAGISMISESGIEQPYGYAPHDVHVIARIDGRVVGHVRWAHREIDIGLETVAIAGIGGVLVSDEARGMRLGGSLMERAEQSMKDHHSVAFGYLGCRK
ncbi:GNAT family N-acetyltransferase [Pseudactinotalea sp. HY160]|uniref:GNAT family N-acetyltransferase n=1 Tax=Pseudactinotalea sp. HY160 TaxID=2654490 RepID=UPI00351B112A